MSTRKDRIEQIFAEALDLPFGERDSFLQEQCGDNAELKEQVESLLASYNDSDGFLEGAEKSELFNLGKALHDSLPAVEMPGDRIDRYKLLERLGEGGWGVVWMAEQSEPIRRRVALKILKLGMDTKEFVARFESERQALALMDHPNIARIFDGGATEKGRPYFVMELVRGIRLTEYCDKNRLKTKERLELFIKVCQAVQHAHQKGIIHRDLKPSNILVTVNDGEAVPKVIDFGVAKAMDYRLTEKTLFTRFQSFVGTPVYTSPEQAEMSSVDVDTRSDVYSLGVLLYELVSGKTPFDSDELVKEGFAVMRKIISETDPPLPSVQLNSLAEADRTTIAERRSIEAEGLPKLLRGDLDWITMKCLEKNRSRRYETVNGLAMDISRFLNHEPVAASPPSAWYQFQKFVVRNKLGVAVTVAISFSLVISVVANTILAIKAKEAETEHLRLTKLAQLETTKSEKIAGFLKDMFQDLDPIRGLDSDPQAFKEILEFRELHLNNELAEYPAMQAELQALLESLGSGTESEEAPEIIEEKEAQLLAASALRAEATILQGEGHFNEALSKAEKALAYLESVYGPDHWELRLVLGRIAKLYFSLGRYELAEKYFKQVLAILEDRAGKNSHSLRNALNGLAGVYNIQGKFFQAEPLYRRVFELEKEAKGEDHWQVASFAGSLARLYDKWGNQAETEYWKEKAGMYREADLRQWLAQEKEMRPGRSPVAWQMFKLAELYRYQGRTDEAKSLYAQALAIFEKNLGPDHPDVGFSLNKLAVLYDTLGDIDQAEPLYERSLVILEKAWGLDHQSVAASRIKLVEFYISQGKYAKAERLLKRAIEMFGKKTGSEVHSLVVDASRELAALYKDLGKPEEAQYWKEQAALAEQQPKKL